MKGLVAIILIGGFSFFAYVKVEKSDGVKYRAQIEAQEEKIAHLRDELATSQNRIAALKETFPQYVWDEECSEAEEAEEVTDAGDTD